MEKNKKPKFEDSLKALEMENFFDRIFYRPAAFHIAVQLAKTHMTPNIVTIISIFFGVAAGISFYPNDLWINVLGIALLIIANTLDCVDGQLARLTGIKSEVGRILDGLAGDFWFIAIYICIALHLTNLNGFAPALAWTLASLAGASQLVQANITDYYKTLHLFFISKEKGSEFDTVDRVREKHAQMPRGISKVLYWLYISYTILQSKATPQLQKLLARLSAKYGEDIPEDVRTDLRRRNLKIVHLVNLQNFNWRSPVLFISILAGHLWIYLVWEIVVLNALLLIARLQHENMCRKFEI